MDDVKHSTKTNNDTPDSKAQLRERLEKRLALLKQQIAQRKDVEEALRRESAFVKLLQEIAVAANDADTLEDAFQFAVDRICKHTGWQIGHVYMVSSKDDVEVVSSSIWYCHDEEVNEGTALGSVQAMDTGWLGEVISTGQPIWIRSDTDDQDLPSEHPLMPTDIQASIVFPILVGSEVVAMLAFFSTETVEPDEDMLDVMAHIGTQLGRVIERVRARESLQRSQALLKQAEQMAHLGSWEWDIQRDKVTWSDGLYRICGLDPDSFDVSYETFMEVVHPEDRDEVDQVIQNAYRSRASFSGHERIVRPDGAVRTLFSRGKPVYDQNGELSKMLGICQDVTELQEAETKLDRQARQLEALNRMGRTLTASLDRDVVYENVLATFRPLCNADGIFILLLQGEEFVLAAADEIEETQLGAKRMSATEGIAGEVIRTGGTVYLRGEDAGQELSWAYEHLSVSSPQAVLAIPLRLHGRWIGVMLAVHGDPEAFDNEDIQLLESAAGWVAIALQNAKLFGQVRASRQRLRRLTKEIVTAQEQERQRVSRELHDDAGQSLLVLKMNLEMIADSLPQLVEPEQLGMVSDQLAETVSLADQTMEQIRSLAHNLRPPALDALSLNPSLEGLCENIAKVGELNICFSSTDLPTLTDPVAISIYRFLQEALTNVVKHADASKVDVELEYSDNAVHLSVSDDGKGFSTKAYRPVRSHGIGLVGMQERFELLGGQVTIDSEPGRGTSVSATVPVEATQVEEDYT